MYKQVKAITYPIDKDYCIWVYEDGSSEIKKKKGKRVDWKPYLILAVWTVVLGLLTFYQATN